MLLTVFGILFVICVVTSVTYETKGKKKRALGLRKAGRAYANLCLFDILIVCVLFGIILAII